MVVSNRTVIYTQTNTPGPPWEEGDIGPWHVCLCQPGAKCSTIPLKGDIIPGSSLYQEHYNVTYERTHCWWQDIDVNLSGNHTVIRIWDNRTDTMIESVSLDTLLQWAASFGGTHDDVTDILYENDTLQDPNLQETLDTYRGQHPDSQPEKQQLITTLGNTGATGLQTEIPGLIPQWVQTTSWEAFEDIWDNLSQLTLNHGCNATQYPYPLTLLDHTIANLSALFTAHIQENLAYDRYHPGQRFCSVGMKAVFHARAWLLDSINTSLINTAATLHAALTQILEAAIPASSGYTADSIEETITHTIDALRDKFTIPYGTPMILANPQSPTWTESVLLAVNQIPHVLDPFQPISSGQEQLWTLKLRNRCIFGPTGRPILPLTPVTPWILTMNLWCIDVEGEFLRFEVDDANNEAVYNPLIGHSPQPYVREACVITNGSTILGENTRLHFAYSTISLAVVPAFGMMCGDLQPNWANDATPGYS